MHFSVIFKILGALLMLFSVAMLPPLILALVNGENTVSGFVTALTITFFSGLTLWLPTKGAQHELRIRDGFLITSLFWTVLGLFGGLPSALTPALDLTPAEAAFESISGLTTTGATVIVGLDTLPQ